MGFTGQSGSVVLSSSAVTPLMVGLYSKVALVMSLDCRINIQLSVVALTILLRTEIQSCGLLAG